MAVNHFAGNFGSPVQLLILLAIVLLLFGGNRLRNLGADLGSAIKGFKNSVGTPDEKQSREKLGQDIPVTIDAKADVVKNQHNA